MGPCRGGFREARPHSVANSPIALPETKPLSELRDVTVVGWLDHRATNRLREWVALGHVLLAPLQPFQRAVVRSCSSVMWGSPRMVDIEIAG